MGRLTSIDRASTDGTRTCDNANRLLTIDNTSVGQATYTWDANSNKLSEAWTGNMAAWSFTAGTSDGYDAEDRFRRFIQSSQSNDIFIWLAVTLAILAMWRSTPPATCGATATPMN